MNLKHTRNLRYRITLGFSLFVIAITVILFLIVSHISYQQEENLIDHIVSEEMDNLIEQYQINPKVKPHQTQNLTGYIAYSKNNRKYLPEALQNLKPGFHEIFPLGKEYHVVVRDLNKVRFYLSYDVSYHEKRFLSFEWMVFLIFASITAISLLLGYYLSGLLIKPVSDLADRVDNLHNEGTSTPLATRYKDHEVIRLASSFDNYVSHIKTMISREQSFAADVSHELRTPLTSIKTSCELLKLDKINSQKSYEHLDRISRGCKHITELVDSLLYLARGENSTDKEMITIFEIVKSVLDPFSKSIKNKNIYVDIKIVPNVWIIANSTALKIVISNLLKNAIKYSKGGKITIIFNTLDLSLSIIDTGTGIYKENLSLIFNRFYRCKETNDETTGFGLGLSIAKKFCDYYGWKIDIESTPGKGTTARVIFPHC